MIEKCEWGGGKRADVGGGWSHWFQFSRNCDWNLPRLSIQYWIFHLQQWPMFLSAESFSICLVGVWSPLSASVLFSDSASASNRRLFLESPSRRHVEKRHSMNPILDLFLDLNPSKLLFYLQTLPGYTLTGLRWRSSSFVTLSWTRYQKWCQLKWGRKRTELGSSLHWIQCWLLQQLN